MIFTSILFFKTSVAAQKIPTFNFLPIVERADQDFEEVKGLIQTFETFGARYTTSSGYEKTKEFILDWFKRYLENVTTHAYNLTVLVDYGGSLTLENGDRLDAYPLMPNIVVPVYCENLSGPLVYVGEGELKDLDGKPIKDSIVLMDFNSGLNWLNVAKLGAKAVIFLEPTVTNREQAMQKRLENIPYDFPRFYLEKDAASHVLTAIRSSSKPVIGILNGKTRWEIRRAENIMGFIRGTKYPDRWVILSAYYDALSVVPSKSTGASEAISMAILLTLAKYYSENPADYTLMFIAFSGHNQGIWGARVWVEKYLYGPDNSPDSPYYSEKTIASNVVGAFGISITPDTPLLYPSGQAGFYVAESPGTMPSEAAVFVVDSYKLLMEQTGKDYGLIPIGTGEERALTSATQLESSVTFQTPNFLRWDDLEALFVASDPACPGYIFTTARRLDVFYYTPTDTYASIEPYLPNVKAQMELLYTWLFTFLHTDYLHTLPQNRMDSKWGLYCSTGNEGLHSNHQHYMRDKLRVVTFNLTTGWYTPLKTPPGSQTLVTVHTYACGTYGFCVYGNRLAFVVLTDEQGVAEIIGHYGAAYAAQTWREFNAYVLNEQGKITHIRDFGQYQLPQEISWAALLRGACRGKAVENTIDIVVFEAGGLMLFDYEDPNYLDYSFLSFGLSARYFEGHTPLIQYNLAAPRSTYVYIESGWCMAMAYVEPNVPVELILFSPYIANRPYAVFINASHENPKGSGYTIKPGQQLHLTIFDYACDLYYINEQRISLAEQTKLMGEYYRLHATTRQLLNEMEDALNKYQYTNAYAKAVQAWKTEMRAYALLRESLEGAVYTVPFFCAMIIPFVFLAERLFLESRGFKRLFYILGIFLFSVAIFSFMHPGFILASSTLTVLVSFAILALIIPVLGVISGQTSTMLSAFRRKTLGIHVREVGRLAFGSTAISTGIAYMRKKRFRTILTLLSVMILSIALVLFTSVSGLEVTKLTEEPLKFTPPYEGIILQREYFGFQEGYRYGVGIRGLEYLQSAYGKEAIICPRAWLWPSQGYNLDIGGFLIVGPHHPSYKPYVIRAVLGLTPQEVQLIRIADALVGNRSRWFDEGDTFACILPETVAKALGIPIDLPSEGVRINLCGIYLTVVGIVGPYLDNIVDMNGAPITPLDFRVTGTPPAQLFHHEIIIVPYKLMPFLMSCWASTPSLVISEVALKFHDVNVTLSRAMEIFETFKGSTLQVWAYQAEKLYLLTVARSVMTIGMREQSIALAIVGLTIFNLMLSSVYERRRELHIFSSVGLNPLQISLMFIAEAFVYALIGSLIGYILAMTIGKIAISLGIVTIFMNYASEWVAGAIGVALLATLLSTIYPIFVASRIVTPSLERRWTIPTKPVGNEWTIPLPFYAATESEAWGILQYVREFISHHMSPVAPDFSVSTLNLEKTAIGEKEAYVVTAETRIVPYDRGIRQLTRIYMIKGIDRWDLLINLTRLAGSMKDWVDHNRNFIRLLREQLLLWRTLPEEEKSKYRKEIKT